MDEQSYSNNPSSYKEEGIIMQLINWLPNTLTNLFTSSFSFKEAQNPVTELVKRVCQGVLGALYAGMVLFLVLLVSAVAGFVLVNYWVEEPVLVSQKLYFDYTEVNPSAVVVFDGGKGVVPVGHRFRVSVSLLVPDSEYNRDIGVFQLVAEVISTNGKVIARSSQPSMLRFQSHPIRLMRTFARALPLVLGLTRETQMISINALSYKETVHSRTETIVITLMPRARTSYLPQLYEAEILIESKLPRLKQWIYNWRWTLYVWTSSYIYILLLLILVYFFMPLLVYPVTRAPVVRTLEIEERSSESKFPGEKGFTESLRKWQQYRKKRKAELLSTKDDTVSDENVGSSMSASSYTVTKDDIVPSVEEDVGDSESVYKEA
ncbi:seipin-1 [Silene latifolia]|uniref:seipin-1 n=1 Tax=Silene latifolia TaxID=37657 RepID=UPI003D77212C